MSNTPPVRADDLSRSARNFPGAYLYSGAGGLDFNAAQLLGEQPGGLGAYRQSVDPVVESQTRGASFRAEPGSSGRNEARSSSRIAEDDGYRMRNEEIKRRDMNPGFEGEYKGLDNAAGLNMVLRNGDYDPIRSLNNYSSESPLRKPALVCQETDRNFTPKPKEQPTTFPEMTYGHLQQRQSSIDHRFPTFHQFLPTSSMFQQQITPTFNSQYRYDMLQTLLPQIPYPREVPSYSMERRTNLPHPHSYSSPVHLGLSQAGSNFFPYPEYTKSDIERGTYTKYPSPYGSPLDLKKVNDTDPHTASRHATRHDGYSQQLVNYPRSASTIPDLSKKYSQNVGDSLGFQGSLFSANGVRQNEPPMVDLTKSISPEFYPHTDARTNVPVPRERSAPPAAHEQRNTPKENGSHHQADLLKERESQRNYSQKRTQNAAGHFPATSMSPFAGLLPFPPSALPVPGYNSIPPSSFNPYENSLSETARSHSASKGLDHALVKPSGHQWPHATRYHTPSPHQFSSLELTKKNSSPSLQYKTKPDASDLSFNFPEASGGKSDQPQSGTKYLDNGLNSAKTQLWPKKDDSKLSPYENHIMDSARDGKPCTNFGKFDNVPHARSRMLPSHHMMPNNHAVQRTSHVPEYPPPKPIRVDNVIPRNTPEPKINSVSVIQTVPKIAPTTEPPRKPKDTEVPQKEEITPMQVKSDLNTDIVQNPDAVAEAQKMTTYASTSKVDNAEENTNLQSKPGRKRRSSKSKDGEQKPKRKYTKRSEVWKHRVLLKQQQLQEKKQQQEQRQQQQQQQLMQQEIKQQPVEQATTETATEPTKDIPDAEKKPNTQSADPAPAEKISRPQRKSGGPDMEEYLYWFTEEETENDDSSDEDYSCPTKVHKIRGCRALSNQRPTRTLPARRSSEAIRTREISWDTDDDYQAEEVLKRVKRRRRKSEMSKTPEMDKTREQAKSVELQVEKEKSPQEADSEKKVEAALEKLDDKAAFAEKLDDKAAVAPEKSEDPVSEKPQEKVSESAESIQPKEPSQPEPVRIKRKYTRRLDKDGLPIKRMRNVVKSVEVTPKQKRKYTKKAKKWFKLEMPSGSNHTALANDKQEQEQNIESHDNIAKDIPMDIKTTPLKHVEPETQKSPHHDVQKSPRQRRISSQSTSNSTISQSLDATHPTITLKIHTHTEESSPIQSMHAVKQESFNDVTEASAVSEVKKEAQPPIKIHKKRGRKPGWRKYPPIAKDGGSDSVSADLQSVVKKKYKKPKGDGLSRFGMRKRCRRPKIKLPIPNAAPGTIVTTPVRSQDANKQPGQVRQKRKYNVESRRLKRRQYLISIGRLVENKDTASTSKSLPIPSKKTDIHKISQELQSQEYDYDFNKSLSLYYEDDLEDVDENSMPVQSMQDESSEQPSSSTFLCQSRPQTPTDGTPLSQQSSFPAHLKKLCCNTAIGETQLHKAARIGAIENLQYYLENGTNANQSDNAGYTALHEACMRNNLEAASLLLQYRADVNKHAVDGTRPLHDAVEYDHLEMVRLMLACGADPMLSKFSGRSIPNMIIKRSPTMKQFINEYLQQLKEIKDSETPDKSSEWKFPCSAIFDKLRSYQYNTLDFTPDPEDLSIEFEMFDKPPCASYLLQPDEESERANYCLLDDYLNAIGKCKGKSTKSIRVITMPVESFKNQIWEKKLQRLQYGRSREKPDLSGDFIEVVMADDSLTETTGGEVVKISLSGKGNVMEQNCRGAVCQEASDFTDTNIEPNCQRWTEQTDYENASSGMSEELLSQIAMNPAPMEHEESQKERRLFDAETDVNSNPQEPNHNSTISLDESRDVPNCQTEVSHKELPNQWANPSDLNSSNTVDEVR